MPLLRISIVALLATCLLCLSGLRPSAPSANAADCTERASPADAQQKINSAAPGTVLCLDAGVYRGPLIFESKSRLTVRGAGARQTIVAGGDKDGMLIFRSRDVTFEDFTLFLGNPANAYVWASTNINFLHMDVGGGHIGIHFDNGSLGRVTESFVYALLGDGVLTRNASNVTVERNWIFVNGGVGVSTVGGGATTNVSHNIISDNRGPGVFAGITPCALLPPAVVDVPDCYLTNLRGFVSNANVILDTNIVQASGSTGIVLFPGTTATMRNNRVWANHLTGLFGWGAYLSSQGDEYDGNDEHAIELRAYPDPIKYAQIPSSERTRAVGVIDSATIRNSIVLPETGTLGGGLLAQGSNVTITNSQVYGNRGIGVSYVNTSLGRIENNAVHDNRGSAICEYRAGSITVGGNTIYGNADDTIGVCHETTP